MNRIGNGLKKQRENSGLTVKQVVAALQAKGIAVSDKTVYAWESGYRMPDADMLLVLCDIYATQEILSAFGYDKRSAEAEAKEDTVRLLNQLSPEDKAYIIELAQRLAKRE